MPGPDVPDGASEALVAELLGDAVTAPPHGERRLTVDQTHTTVVVGSPQDESEGRAVAVKWRREPVLEDRAWRLGQRLAAAGFAATPALVGRSVRTTPEGPATVALATRWVPDAEDGWTWCVDDVLAHLAGGPMPGWPAQLGRVVAELHAALADASPSLPGQAVVRDWRDGGRRLIATVLAESAASPQAEVRDAADVLSRAAPLLRAAVDAMPEAALCAQDLHGDLHVGQLLRDRQHRVWVVDLDGNPLEPAAGHSGPDRDLVQLAVSLRMVSAIVGRRDPAVAAAADAWADRAVAALERAYDDRSAELGRAATVDPRVRPGLAAVQLAREVGYAARYLPRWAYAPSHALRRLLEG